MLVTGKQTLKCLWWWLKMKKARKQLYARKLLNVWCSSKCCERETELWLKWSVARCKSVSARSLMSLSQLQDFSLFNLKAENGLSFVKGFGQAYQVSGDVICGDFGFTCKEGHKKYLTSNLLNRFSGALQCEGFLCLNQRVCGIGVWLTFMSKDRYVKTSKSRLGWVLLPRLFMNSSPICDFEILSDELCCRAGLVLSLNWSLRFAR